MTVHRNIVSLISRISLVAMLVAASGCDSSPQPKTTPDDSKSRTKADSDERQSAPSQDQPDAAPAVLNELPDFQLVDQDGTAFGLEDLRGKVWVANFIFTNCQGTCPEQSMWMRRLQERLKSDPAAPGIRLVTFTVDPERDTPDVLKTYAKEYEADPSMWHFLTGERTAIWQLARDGFHLPVQDNPEDKVMPILHDTKFVIVDRMGRIRAYNDVLAEAGIDGLAKSILKVVPEYDPGPGPWQIADEPTTHLAHPSQILDMDWLAGLDAKQKQSLANAGVEHTFQFVDRREASGITFKNQIVDEQRWRLQVNHYDHGNGISAGDVDGDGRIDLYFVNQAGRNELWRNLGDGRFEDITDRAGVAVSDGISVGAAFADTDNDGDPDLFVTTVGDGNHLFLNDGKGNFTDITEQAGLNYRGHSSAPVFFDYNRDGRLDLLVCNVGRYTSDEELAVRADRFTRLSQETVLYNAGIPDAFGGHLKDELSESSILYRNEGQNQFVDVTEEVGLVDDSWSGDATAIDVDEDGWLDLYVLNMQGTDQLYRNDKGERFVRETEKWFPRSPWGAMGVQVIDINNDGRMDLYVTDMHSDMSEDIGLEREKLKSRMQWPDSFLQSDESGIYGNALYVKQADGSYLEQSDQLGAENYWPWGLSAGDLNADGLQDVFIASSMCFPYRYSVNSVLLNQSGQQFLDSEFAVGVEPRSNGQLIVPWFELDCDGKDAEHPLVDGRAGRAVVWSAVGSRSSLLVDFDDDGDLDVVTNEFNTEPQILVSNLRDTQPDRHFLKVKLVGNAANRDGLGAVVKVTAGDLVQHQFHDGRSGYLSQSSMPLYFGLGHATQVDSIEIRWLGEAVQVIEGPIEVDQLMVAEQL